MSKDTDTFTPQQACQEMMRRSDEIITVSLAKQIAGAFGMCPHKMKVVYRGEAGIDWSDRATRTRGGLMVNVCSLAQALAEDLDAPPADDIETGYLGSGKRARALTEQGVTRLRRMGVKS